MSGFDDVFWKLVETCAGWVTLLSCMAIAYLLEETVKDDPTGCYDNDSIAYF